MLAILPSFLLFAKRGGRGRAKRVRRGCSTVASSHVILNGVKKSKTVTKCEVIRFLAALGMTRLSSECRDC